MARTPTPKGFKSAAKTGEAAGVTIETKESDDKESNDDDLPPDDDDESTSSEESGGEEAKTDEAVKAAQAKMDEATKAAQTKQGATASGQKATKTTPPIGSKPWWDEANPDEVEQFYMR